MLPRFYFRFCFQPGRFFAPCSLAVAFALAILVTVQPQQARSVRQVYIVAKETKVYLPHGYQWQHPSRRYAEQSGARLDLFSRGFKVGDAVYAEIRLPENVQLTSLYLDDRQIPLSKTSFGYRCLFAIPSNFMAQHMELKWSVPQLKLTKYLALRPQSQKWPVKHFYQRVNPAPKKLSSKQQAHIDERQKQFLDKLTKERRIKKAAFEIRSADMIATTISHPRDMHYITSPIFGRRIQVHFTMKNKKRQEVGRWSIIHNGVDLRGKPGAPIFAMLDGRVVLSQPMHFEGNYTVIDHGQGIFTGYMHQSKRHVQVGQTVRSGDFIGEVGSTGYSTGPHLHATLTIRGVVADPLSLLMLPIRK